MSQTIRRLSRADLSNLRYETPAAPMQIGVLLIIDGAPLLDADGRVRFDEIRRRVDVRLTQLPALRRRLLRPGVLQGGLVWVDDPAFDITRHVRSLCLRPAAEEAQLVAAAERLMSTPLVRTRPLWELWVIGGLGNGHVGMLLKLHHAVADGLAAVAMLGSLFDLDPLAPDPPAVPYRPEPAPSPWRLFVDNLSTTMHAAQHGLRLMHHPFATWRTVHTIGAEFRRALRAPSAPRTTINGPVQPGRRMRFTRFHLEELRAVGHAAGGTINDVVLDLVAGGLRELLLGRSETVDRPLIASVPVALRSAADAATLGNAAGTIAVPLDVEEPDPRQRLEKIIRATRAAKREQHPEHVQAAMAWLAATPFAHAFITRQRLVNIFITNVAGPPVPMYMLGARILDVVPLVSPVGNVAAAFCAFSYAGSLFLVTTVDTTGFPDVDRLINGMRQTWDGLLEHQAQAVPRFGPSSRSVKSGSL